MLIVPVPRFGLAGASTALLAIVDGRKLPLHRLALPVATRPAPDDAHAIDATTQTKTPNRAIIVMLRCCRA